MGVILGIKLILRDRTHFHRNSSRRLMSVNGTSRIFHTVLDDSRDFFQWILGCRYIRKESGIVDGLKTFFHFSKPQYLTIEENNANSTFFLIEEPQTLNSKLAVVLGIVVAIFVLFLISDTILNFYRSIFSINDPPSGISTPVNLSPKNSVQFQLPMNRTSVLMNEPVNCVYIRPSTPPSTKPLQQQRSMGLPLSSMSPTSSIASPIQVQMAVSKEKEVVHEQVKATATASVSQEAKKAEPAKSNDSWRKICEGKSPVQNPIQKIQKKAKKDDDTVDMDSPSERDVTIDESLTSPQTPSDVKKTRPSAGADEGFNNIGLDDLPFDLLEILNWALVSNNEQKEASVEELREIQDIMGQSSEEDVRQETDKGPSGKCYDKIDDLLEKKKKKKKKLKESWRKQTDEERFDILIDESPFFTDSETFTTGCVKVSEECQGSAVVRFRWTDSAAQNVTLTGSFFGWSLELPLIKSSDGSFFAISLTLPTGTHEYRMDISPN
ncbi:unnamed protein product [Caenorhabditis auriculariae]|uniref:AMP-activated protein kinase glycogen-binding domain-containing protein n=1 Tax=Caenorhabditis auriculariae TaxID=2777116 RepID=A0A8S1HA59_9PELO|nr:unnamed protein product [Caenorhabditis auriculariae]